ncbi:MAG: UpxY family transcription antiterminator [Candidatus Acidiferrum sp.]
MTAVSQWRRWQENVALQEQADELWYAAHLRAHHEKKVAAEFQRRDVEHFLPVYRSLRRWKDRLVNLELPLFPGYAFVRLALRNRLRVLQVPGVVRLVGPGGVPESLPEQEMEQLRAGTNGGGKLAPHPYLVVGSKARIVRGPLAGAEGILIRQKNAFRMVLSIGLIASSASMEVDAADIEGMP